MNLCIITMWKRISLGIMGTANIYLLQYLIKGDINVVNATNSANVNIAARNNNFNGFNQFFKSYSQYYVGTSYKPTNSTSTNLPNFPPNPSRDGGY